MWTQGAKCLLHFTGCSVFIVLSLDNKDRLVGIGQVLVIVHMDGSPHRNEGNHPRVLDADLQTDHGTEGDAAHNQGCAR